VAALLRTREDSLLAKSIFIKGFFWFAGSLQILIINAMVLNQFRQTMTMTSIMVGIELVGIGVGSILSPVFAQGKRWYRGLVPSGLLMAAGMFAVAVVPYLPGQACKPAVAGALMLIGIGGGVFCIPVTSFVQIRPSAEIKGKIIAASNLADFTGILVAGGVYYVFDRLCIKPTSYFALEALMVMAIVLWLMMTLPKEADNA
jgi:acyl-[acyl-carrier-protein]-phospholipid O-acyltransferase/long-chain-fatty-acid--[acyl-carrier-protein] ligase